MYIYTYMRFFHAKEWKVGATYVTFRSASLFRRDWIKEINLFVFGRVVTFTISSGTPVAPAA